ncbi:rab-interacting lysosomal protein [Elgaria multicarinata webbii]|uniref:rab-interacting lysosomal protein n=1 Tax=Elgaria multicarinata webbii TaxID=159646 RepID=UPI002FCD2787
MEAAAAAAAVYRLAGTLGSELQRLSGLFGPGAVAGLVAQVVRLLELLEALAAARGDRGGTERPEAASASGGEPGPPPARGANQSYFSHPTITAWSLCPPSLIPSSFFSSLQVLEQQLAEVQEQECRLRSCLAQLEEENRELVARLASSQAQEDSTVCKERELMLRLKEVVDKQRDEIRAQAHDILSKSRDMEALQEQLSRFMSMNEELRRKLAVAQVQLRSALQKKEDLENLVLEARQEAERLSRAGGATEPSEAGVAEGAAAAAAPTLSQRMPGRSSFSREELQQVLQERNELKTNLFLVQEELAYYQRELLNNERIPRILLDAVKSTIKKQRKKIRAKMLGTAEEAESSEEEEEEEEEEEMWLTGDPDSVDGCLPESRIKSFFGLWYRRNSKSSSPGGNSGAWEIVNPQDTCPEEEERPLSRGSSPPSLTSPLA